MEAFGEKLGVIYGKDDEEFKSEFEEVVKKYPKINKLYLCDAATTAHGISGDAPRIIGGLHAQPTRKKFSGGLSDVMSSIWSAALFIGRLAGMKKNSLSHQEAMTLSSTASKRDKCPVKAIAVHPLSQQIALSRYDDGVEIHYNREPKFEVLVHEKQQVVMALAWDPNIYFRLAVGCRNGVLLWGVSGSDVRGSSRPVFWIASLPVYVLAWSPDGIFLAGGAPLAKSICIWDVDRQACSEIIPGGTCLLSWAPDGSSLLATTISNKFHIWNTTTWRKQTYVTPAGNRCQAACWGMDSQVLLVSEADSSLIYSLQLKSEKAEEWSAVFDTANLGGSVQALAWMDTRVVVVFSGNQQVGWFGVITYSIHPELRYIGPVTGPPSCTIQFLEFQNAKALRTLGLNNLNAMLHMCWLDNQGNVEFRYFPILKI